MKKVIFMMVVAIAMTSTVNAQSLAIAYTKTGIANTTAISSNGNTIYSVVTPGYNSYNFNYEVYKSDTTGAGATKIHTGNSKVPMKILATSEGALLYSTQSQPVKLIKVSDIAGTIVIEKLLLDSVPSDIAMTNSYYKLVNGKITKVIEATTTNGAKRTIAIEYNNNLAVTSYTDNATVNNNITVSGNRTVEVVGNTLTLKDENGTVLGSTTLPFTPTSITQGSDGSIYASDGSQIVKVVFSNKPYPGNTNNGGNNGGNNNEGKTSEVETSEITFAVYPNPTTDFITIKGIDNPKVEVICLTGNIVIISNDNQIDLSYLPNGIYFVRINNLSTTIVKK
jgi:hypothetical protein